MSKPRADPSLGISSGDVLILPEPHPACRRREARPGSCMEGHDLTTMELSPAPLAPLFDSVRTVRCGLSSICRQIICPNWHPDLGEAIHDYFACREMHEQRRLRLLFRDGRIALDTGLAFLSCCVLLRELAFSFGHGAVSDIVGEGMLIIGWVAMWRPLEIFLYEWVPLRRRCRIPAKLSKMPVIVQPK
jgi:hypothetical protein